MRFLNKIIFINSANVAYAEINLDGNVHFIGTQGAGKSTALRAILFFYNADKLKLGIEKGKRTFDDYYFPYGNSYLIYELARETGSFCVMAFKSQGRVAYRFIDGPYRKENFIGIDGKALTWDHIRATMNGSTSYSRKIDRYEEYRDILYGNNKGLAAEYRKYALIESKQYQNLPRTIQNVFLNSKLEAEFIKQTIIMSLNEEDVKIDLDQYAFHLRDFEQQLADISKWTDKNRSGDIVVRSLAASIIKVYIEIRFLDKESITVALQLLATHSATEKLLPELKLRLEKENEKLAVASKRVAEANSKFQDKRDKILKEVTLLEGKLTESKSKAEHYEQINIHVIIDRVSQRAALVTKQEQLTHEKNLLSARFIEITAKYEALIKQTENQLSEYINLKNSEKNSLKEAHYLAKEEVRQTYEQIIDETVRENAEVKANAEAAVRSGGDFIHDLELEKREVELKRWYEKEIEEHKKVIKDARQLMTSSAIEIFGAKGQVESLQKQWDLDLAKYDAEHDKKIERSNEAVEVLTDKIAQINTTITQRKDSLYDWLHENKPGWEQNIGKVINQEHILFHSGLAPRLNHVDSTFYGIEINLEEIAGNVKTITDYENDSRQMQQEIAKLQSAMETFMKDRLKEIEKYKKKYQPQIKAFKEQIVIQEYSSQKAAADIEKGLVQLEDWQRKASAAQESAVTEIKQKLQQAREVKKLAEERVAIVNKQTNSLIEVKKKEREIRIAEIQSDLQSFLVTIDQEIVNEEAISRVRIAEIKSQVNHVLEDEGADTVRISEIERKALEVTAELLFIENNRNQVADYLKDKRELFDLADEFKAKKKLNETRLRTEQEKHEAVKEKLQGAVNKIDDVISGLKSNQNQAEEDLSAYDTFIQTEVFAKLNKENLKFSDAMRVDRRLVDIIADLNDKSFGIRNKTDDLRSSISRFISYFSVANIFGFKTNLIEHSDYFQFAENLKEFMEEDKIAEYEKRTNERFASLIMQIGKETTELVSKEAIIQRVINEINKDFEERMFAGVIKSITLRLSHSANKVVMLLSEIRSFNDAHLGTLGSSNLFSNGDTEQSNKKAVGYLKTFANEIASSKQQEINLSDTFELQFRIVENQNDSGWVEKLSNVGSEGTDILVKAMINIMLLNVFKESASKRFKDFRLHCMMDEIGKLHPTNVKGILKFANDRNIVLINSSPTSYNALEYKHTYLLSKDSKSNTRVKKLLTNN